MTLDHPQSNPQTTTHVEDTERERRISERREATDGNGRPLTRHLSDLTHEVVDLLRQEMALARAEANEKVDQAKRGVTEMATGGAVLAGGGLVLLLAVVFLIDLVLPLWLSALIVGGVTAGIGASMVGKGKRDVSSEKLRPNRTIGQLQRDQHMVKEKL